MFRHPHPHLALLFTMVLTILLTACSDSSSSSTQPPTPGLTPPPSSAPKEPSPDQADIVAISGGGYHSLALKNDGSVVVWGSNSMGQANVPANLSGVVAVSAGVFHSLALREDGSVVAWGSNSEGQANVPADLSGVVAIAAGSDHSLALKKDGSVVAWGSNDRGQTTVPSGLNDVVAVASGLYHSLALKQDGSVVAWGWNENGQADVPVGLSNIVAIAAGWRHSLALRQDGSLVAWGWNEYGLKTIPAGLNDVTAVATIDVLNLVLKKDGSVAAWGLDKEGEKIVPTGLGDVVAVSAGGLHSLALKEDCTLVAWGRNAEGQADVPTATPDDSCTAPSVNLTLSSTTIASDQPIGTVVGTVLSSAEGAALTYSLVSGEGDADNGNFVLEGTQLKTTASLDYREEGYSVRVQADNGAWKMSQNFTINMVSAPTELALSGTTIAENQPTGTVIGTLSATDEDNDTLTYSLVSGEGDSDNASFSIDGNQLKTQAAFDFEAKSSYGVRVQVSDGSNVLAQDFTITVTNVDEPATDLTLSSTEVEELQPIGAGVGTLGNNDPEDDSTLSYSLVEGEGDTDNATFKIEDGELQTNDFLDFETKNSYSVRVQGVGEGVSLAKNFTISVTNLDDTAPNLDWTDPGTLAVGEPVTLSGTVTDDPTDIDSGVASVGVYIDTTPEDDAFDEANKLGDATLSGDTWSFTYTPEASGDINLAVLARDGSELANGAAFYRTVTVEEDDTPD